VTSPPDDVDGHDPEYVSRYEAWPDDEPGGPLAAEDGQPLDKWRQKWAPLCPDGHPQVVRRAQGFRERNVGELELRVLLGGNDNGVCTIALDERDDRVYVRVIVCYDESEPLRRVRDWTNCPVRIWLEQPLGARTVIDVDTHQELPLYIPAAYR
jgi:hypothetical protein